jgi:hypothetical protein
VLEVGQVQEGGEEAGQETAHVGEVRGAALGGDGDDEVEQEDGEGEEPQHRAASYERRVRSIQRTACGPHMGGHDVGD